MQMKKGWSEQAYLSEVIRDSLLQEFERELTDLMCDEHEGIITDSDFLISNYRRLENHIDRLKSGYDPHIHKP
ncbi:hypothetical protein GMB80_13925 [Turicibacter sanguinis]|nr:hypothetical protein [Turicibacter sanguinis]